MDSDACNLSVLLTRMGPKVYGRCPSVLLTRMRSGGRQAGPGHVITADFAVTWSIGSGPIVAIELHRSNCSVRIAAVKLQRRIAVVELQP